MKTTLLRITALILIGLMAVSPADARQAKRTERPRAGAPTVNLPRYPSLEAFRASRTAPSALRAAGAATQGVAIAPPAGIPIPSSRSTVPASAVRIVRAENGTISWMRGDLGDLDLTAGKAAELSAVAADATRQLARWSGVMRLDDPGTELEGTRLETDDLGMTHIRFRQTLEGIPVWAREVIVHADRSGRIVSVNGTYEPSARRPRNRVAVDERDAMNRVERLLRAEGRWNPPTERELARYGIDGPSVTPTWFPLPDGSLVRAWEVSVHPNLVQWYHFIVDAGSGEVLNRYARHCTIVQDPDLGSRTPIDLGLDTTAPESAIEPRAGAFVDATAVDLHGVSRNIRVYRENNGTHYKIWDLPNTTPFNLPQVPEVGSAVTLTANNSDSFDRAQFLTSANNTWTDPSAVSAHLNMKTAYDYYRNTHARAAINNQDQSMISIVHITDGGQPMENAFWTGRIMGYGDGGTTFRPLAGGLDVAAHEMSHGVIEHTANLVYQYQPGALNESMADVFGAFVDRGDYLMGEDIMQPGQGIALRDMENPGSAQLQANFRQPAHMSEFRNLNANQDNGGVHINSGIPNRAAVLVMKAIGYEKAERIYYRALSNYLTRTSQFGDARQALEQSATDLYGAGSPELAAIRSAFDTVGIGAATQGPGGSEGNEVDPIVGNGFVFFILSNGTMAYLEMETGNAYQVDPNTGAVTNGTTQLSTPAGGGSIWYIHRSGNLARFDMTNGTNRLFPNLYVQQEGDLWNVAVTPDESLAILTSTYNQDPNLYVTDGTEMAVIELKAQTTQEGILDESIQFPDVISVSPNPDQPKIAFDALREVVAGTDAIQFWSIYEIDFATERIYNLLASQPEGYSVGNITYGNTDPDLVAFNFIDDNTGVWETYVANMGSGETLLVPTGGVTDAERPSFAPDDSGLVVSSPSTNELIFFDAANGGISKVAFNVPIHNPRWFAVGSPGTAVETAEVPRSFAVRGVFPNPFSRETTVQLGVDRASPVTVSVFDVLGREIERLHDGLLAPGEHAFVWSPGRLANGSYYVKVTGGGSFETRPIVLAR